MVMVPLGGPQETTASFFFNLLEEKTQRPGKARLRATMHRLQGTLRVICVAGESKDPP